MAAQLGISDGEKDTILAELKKMMHKAGNARLYERYQAIYLLLIGKTYDEVALTIDRCRATIFNYASDFKKERLEGLRMDTQPGDLKCCRRNRKKRCLKPSLPLHLKK